MVFHSNRLILLAALLFSTQVHGVDVKVSDAWARATAPGQEVGSVGMIITSKRDAHLIAVSSPFAASAEIHTMTMDNGVMKMRQLEDLPLPAKQPVTLGPGSEHLMLFGLKHALKTGDTVPLTLTIQFADKSRAQVNTSARIEPLTVRKK